MKDFSESDSFLAGQTQAISSFVQAVLMLHPNPKKLVEVFSKIAEEQHARLLGQLVDDAYVEGFSEIRSVVEKTAALLTKK